ncbi:UGT74C1 [Symbiodinium natans]|uniref:UGT74C1 protein n=1 Tax=Symbiodinium natans TaxID=878477 RepID=A0A812JH21_9DINO|nr:UGT74C1 [Symbiodinium natans]
MVRLNNSNFGRLPFQVIGIMIWMYFQVDLGSRQQQQPATGRSQTRVSQDIIILVSYMTLKRPRRPSFGLLGLPFGGVGRELQALGIDFAVNVPTILVPPINPWASTFIPLPFHLVSPHNMTFVDRLLVVGGNSLLNFGRHLAVAAGFQFSFMPDLSPDMWRGRLAFVNSIPGVDYPQLLPPLVQYTGPVVDVKKMEPFPPEVETLDKQTWSWLESVPEGMPVVYVSYGTIVRLTAERVMATLSTLTSTEHFTLWALPKTQQVGLPDTLPPSVMIHHWIPSARALAHPKVKAFVSHCGGNSAVECMAMGKPLIGYPQFGDQMAVCRRIADAGAGITGPQGGWVQAEDVRHVLAEPRYAARAQTMSRLLEKFGGTSRAADLLEMAAAGDLAPLRTPLEGREALVSLVSGLYITKVELGLSSSCFSRQSWTRSGKSIVG